MSRKSRCTARSARRESAGPPHWASRAPGPLPIFLGGMINVRTRTALGASLGAIAVLVSSAIALPGSASAQAPPVDASFTIGTAAPYRVRQPVELVALGSNYPRYVWRFGDGTTGRGVQVTHRFRQEGTYVVSLEVSGGGQSDYRTKRLTVLGAPSGDTLPTIRGHTDRSHKDPEYSRAAGSFKKAATGAWGPRSVFCWSESDWPATDGGKQALALGFVEWRSPRQVNLAPAVCRRLELVHYKRPRPAATRLTAISVLVFTHEVLHTLGVGNEALATCFGLQLAPRMTMFLGASSAYASRVGILLARWYKRENLSPGYWTAACHDGGPLDLDPGSARWPWGQELRGP
jgi:PKD domain